MILKVFNLLLGMSLPLDVIVEIASFTGKSINKTSVLTGNNEIVLRNRSCINYFCDIINEDNC